MPKTERADTEDYQDDQSYSDLARLRELVRRILDSLELLERGLEDLDMALARAMKNPSGARPAADGSKQTGPGGGGAVPQLWPVLGAIAFRMKILPSGASWVSIDGSPDFLLSRRLTSLLRMLVEPSLEAKSDRTIKSTRELKMRLTAMLGGQVTSQNLTSYFRRLRARLRKAGVNEYYVERKRRKGAQFILASGVVAEIIIIGVEKVI